VNVELQDDNECLLATLAALTDRKLSEVREEANEIVFEISGKSWRETLLDNWTKWWQAAYKLGKRLDCVYLVESIHKYCGDDAAIGSSVNIPEKGRGTVLIQWTSGGNHVMPYENGMVVDPLNPVPMLLSDWQSTHAPHKILAIIPYKKKKRR